jgi:hypothetical protein
MVWCDNKPSDPKLCPDFQRQNTDLNIGVSVLVAIIVLNIGILLAIAVRRHVLPHVKRLRSPLR